MGPNVVADQDVAVDCLLGKSCEMQARAVGPCTANNTHASPWVPRRMTESSDGSEHRHNQLTYSSMSSERDCARSRSASDRPSSYPVGLSSLEGTSNSTARTTCRESRSLNVATSAVTGSRTTATTMRLDTCLVESATVSDSLLCTRCEKLLLDPVQVTSCGHRFCRECAYALINRQTQLGTCPKDQQQFAVSSLHSDRQAGKEVSILDVYCPMRGHTQDGTCSWQGTIAQLQDHVKSDSCGCGPQVARAARSHTYPQSRSTSSLSSTALSRQDYSHHSLPAHSYRPASYQQQQHSATQQQQQQQHSSSTHQQQQPRPRTGSFDSSAVDQADDLQSQMQDMRELVSALRQHMFQQFNNHGDAITKLKKDLAYQQERSQQLTSVVHQLKEENTALKQQLLTQQKSCMDDVDSLKVQHYQLAQEQAEMRLSQHHSIATQRHYSSSSSSSSGSMEQDGGMIPSWYSASSVQSLPARLSCTTTRESSNTMAARTAENRLSSLSQDSGISAGDCDASLTSSTSSVWSTGSSVLRSISTLETEMSDMGMRVDMVEQCTTNGRLLWKINNFSQHLYETSQSGNSSSLYSPYFFTNPQGYKMCLRMYPNGDGAGKGTHLSLFLVVMESDYDAVLPWPMNKKIRFRVCDQNSTRQEHCSETFLTTGSGSSFQRPTSTMNVASGVPKLISLDKLMHAGSTQYVKNDTLFLEVTVTDYRQ